ncbi:unnamed protein product [Symbiodinium sp. CCMP2456]|nr:unnamed protein product [Symbiodinium sp. CCMP2456]
MARAVAVAMALMTLFSVLAFVPTPEPQARQALRSRPARAAAPASKLRKLRELPSPALGLLFSCAFCALLLGAAQAGASSRPGLGQDFVTDPPVPRAVLQERRMTKVRLSQAPSRMEIAEKVRRQELEYMQSTYVPGGPKPVRIVAM